MSFYDRVANIVEKGENAGNQRFLFFTQCFQKVSFSGSLKVRIVWQKDNIRIQVSHALPNLFSLMS